MSEENAHLGTAPREVALQCELERIVRATPWLREVLAHIAALDLPDWYLAAGAIRNTVWDALHGAPSAGPHSDLDVIYFDESDAPSNAQARLEAALPQMTWEVTNQATVHRWQSRATGRAIPAYGSITAAMASWPETATAVGVRVNTDGSLAFIAPHGLSDLFALTLRQSPASSDPRAYSSRVREKAWHVRWPRLRIVGHDAFASIAPGNERGYCAR